MAYKLGESILTATPYVHVLYNNWKGIRCDFCFAERSLKKCKRCKWMYYCDRSCQESDWINCHKVECTGKFHQILDDLQVCTDEKGKPKWKAAQIQLVFRYLIKARMDSGSQTRSYQLSSGTTTLRELQIKRDLENGILVLRTASIWTKIVSRPSYRRLFGASAADFCKAAAIIDRYQVRITDTTLSIYPLSPEKIMVGEAFYPELMKFNHCCVPNASFSFQGTTLTLLALKDGLTDRTVRINFVDAVGSPQALWLPTSLRNDTLTRRTIFCHCELCCTDEIWSEKDYQNLMIGLTVLPTKKLEVADSHISALKHYLNITKERFGMHPTLTMMLYRLLYYQAVKQHQDTIETFESLLEYLTVTHRYYKANSQFMKSAKELKACLEKGETTRLPEMVRTFFTERH